MPQVFGDELRQFEILVEKYNQCFYSKDLLALKDMYVSDGGSVIGIITLLATRKHYRITKTKLVHFLSKAPLKSCQRIT